MKVNRGSVLSKDYFHAYLKHIMLVFQCDIDDAKSKTVNRLFRGNLEAYGKDTRQNSKKRMVNSSNNKSS
ncbi:hypothetical protein ACFTRD_12235 [Paenibacillus sp. NPDC056933]|jgi:hypothetical protein|uniref:hypothetical protein n=1 Tax=Paenibacillus sp. NPDC056933 TaxID=3345968 RepID=UPI003641B38B